jgi:hypothetical protein
MKIRVLRSN